MNTPTESLSRSGKRQTLSEQVYEQLKDDIINHRIGFGEKLVNRELQKRFGISSTPVRDAINHLQLDGLLEEITNVGARVVSFDLDFTRELNELVLLLNLGATDLIIQNGRLGELTTALEEIYAEWASIRCMDDYVRLDRLFHQAFFTHCGNQRLVDVYGRYHVLMEMLVRLYAGDNEQRSACINQHEQILKFCRNQDVTGLQQALRDHYSLAADWFTVHTDTLEP